MNLLFLNAGRRVELINEFKKSAKESGLSLKCYATEITEFAPALQFVDQYFILKNGKKRDKVLAHNILHICLEQNINIIIPSIDPDLPFLAQYKNFLEENSNVKVLISEANIVEQCQDKNKTAILFKRNNLLTPEIYTTDNLTKEHLPILTKPINGSASLNVNIIATPQELEEYLRSPSCKNTTIIQKYIQGCEYTADCFIWEGNIDVCPRIRHKVRSGEVVDSEVILNEKYINTIKHFLKTQEGFHGPITIQFIEEKSTGKLFFIEINPRFGGGSILAINAGLKSPKIILTNNYENSFIINKKRMLRYDQSIFL